MSNQVMWTGYFGPIDIKIEHLTESNRAAPGREATHRKFTDLVRESMAKDGLLNPINVTWYLNKQDRDKLIVGPGNDRLIAARELGWKTIPCYLRVYAYVENVDFAVMLKNFLPLIKWVDSESALLAVPDKEWEGNKRLGELCFGKEVK